MKRTIRTFNMNKQTMLIVAIILIVIGIVLLAYKGITYKTEENVVSVGPLRVTTEETKTIPASPVIGGIALGGGIVLLIVALKKR